MLYIGYHSLLRKYEIFSSQLLSDEKFMRWYSDVRGPFPSRRKARTKSPSIRGMEEASHGSKA